MTIALFVLTLALVLGALLIWSFRNLPREKWQILAAVPVVKEASGSWRGMNLTYYGLFTANAYAIGVAILVLLMGSVSVPISAIFVVAVALLLFCVPASKLIAALVEKKPSTFTVGGASFVGIVLAPWIVEAVSRLPRSMIEFQLPVIPTLAALAISYAMGEGLGRLACISFGCCYGKPLCKSHPLIRRILDGHSFIFYGATKKIAYASGMEGEKVIPIQAVTSVLYVLCALCGIVFFLHSHFVVAYSMCIVLTQGWRMFSETLRADYRGEGTISAYQIMAAISVVYSLALPLVLPPAPMHAPDLSAGLTSLWNMAVFIFLQALWLLVFLYTGRSSVTGATLSFHVLKERI